MAGNMSALAEPTNPLTTCRSVMGWSPTLALFILLAILALGVCQVAAVDIDEDLTITGKTQWSEGEWVVSANVTVASGAVLDVVNATITFASDADPPLGIRVEAGGTLLMMNTTCKATGLPYVIESRGHITAQNCDLSGLYTDDNVTISLLGIVGGIVSNDGSLYLENVSILSTGALVTANNTDITVMGLDLEGSDFGLILGYCTGSLSDVSLIDVTSGIIAYRSELDIDGLSSEGAQTTLTIYESEMTVRDVRSRTWGDHLILSNATVHLSDSNFEQGTVGVLVFMGDVHVTRCEFLNTTTAIEFLYAEGSLTDLLVENCWEASIVLNYVGYDVDTPDFTFDNVTVLNGVNEGIHVENSANITLSNVTVVDCGDGIDVISSAIEVVDSVIRGSTQCRPQGCTSSASGVGMLLETSWVEIQNVSVEASHGPGASTYFSVLYATNSRFVDGNVSGILMVYGDLALDRCEVSGNTLWGVESLGYPVDPAELTGTWGNTLADIRLNMTTNVKVVDQTGMWLSHANVTATSGDVVIGPYTTGFGGSTQTFELPILEHTYGGTELDFNPWTFEAVFGEFSDTEVVDLVIGLAEVIINVSVLRPDLQVQEMSVPGKVGPDETVTVRATVVNAGNHSAGAAILTFYYRNDAGFQRVIGETRLDPLEVGGTAEGSVEWTMDIEGDYVIIAHADVNDEVDEEDEENNRLEHSTEVAEGGGDTPGPSALAAVAATIVAAVLVSALRGRRRD